MARERTEADVDRARKTGPVEFRGAVSRPAEVGQYLTGPRPPGRFKRPPAPRSGAVSRSARFTCALLALYLRAIAAELGPFCLNSAAIRAALIGAELRPTRLILAAIRAAPNKAEIRPFRLILALFCSGENKARLRRNKARRLILALKWPYLQKPAIEARIRRRYLILALFALFWPYLTN